MAPTKCQLLAVSFANTILNPQDNLTWESSNTHLAGAQRG